MSEGSGGNTPANDKSGQLIAAGAVLGVGLGAAVGAATGDLGIGMSIGGIIGVGSAFVYNALSKR